MAPFLPYIRFTTGRKTPANVIPSRQEWFEFFVCFGLDHNGNFIFPVIWAKNLEINVDSSLLHPLSSLSVNACASNSSYMQSENFWLLPALTLVWAVLLFCLYYLSCLLTHLPLSMSVSCNLFSVHQTE